MTGLEKINAAILEEAKAEANAILAKAKTEAERIIAEEKEKSDAQCVEIAENGRRTVAEIERACISMASLQRRKSLLEAKQEILAQTMEQALERLYEMPVDAYFDLLIKIVAATAEPGDGELLLNKKDLVQRPADFEKDINSVLKNGCRLRLSETTRPIDGGFILKYGDIEQNCSFRAIFTARWDEMSDKVRDILFA